MTENIDIKQVFWKALQPGLSPDRAMTTPILWSDLYDHGFVDPRRLPKNRWMDILKQLPHEGGRYSLGREHLEKLAQFLYTGPIKRPFDPHRLKDGLRPPPWIQEMYQKVLKFETDIKAAEWNQLVQGPINLTFLENGYYRWDQDFKDFISDILEERASPLRKLELWVFEGAPEIPTGAPVAVAPVPAQKESKGTVVKDRFESSPKELEKIRSIEKLYYHAEKGPAPDDKETLEFLKELDGLEDDGEEIK